MAPTPQVCCFPGCTWGEDGVAFLTDPDLRVRRDIDEAMDRHRRDHRDVKAALVAQNVRVGLLQAAAAPLPALGGAGGGREDKKSRTARAERPALEHGISEADWITFEKNWTRYKRISRITDVQDIVDEVWECMSAGLRNVCAYAQMEENSNTELELLAGVKRLAVRAHNTLIAQERDKAAISYAARLCGKSALCNFKMNCSGCSIKISYWEKVMAHQFVHGLIDSTIQEKVLDKASDGQELTLKDLIGYVESQECGKRSQALLSGAGGLN
jgi:hypothetical protein